MATEAQLPSDHVDTTTKRVASNSQYLKEDDLHSPDTCVICLDRISERATVLPCNHDHFDFACVGTWIQQRRVCPLCKSEVHAIKYASSKVNPPGSYEIFHLPALEPEPEPQQRQNRRSQHQRGGNAGYSPYGRRGRLFQHRRRPGAAEPHDAVLDFRRQVYRNQTYSLHVGTNRISKYRNVTPSTFQSNPHLDSRARIFIRRELSVFEFLNPESAESASSTTSIRRASNAEFLLEYIVSILKSIDLKASTGQAQALLAAFLGSENTRLFLHELEAWLRSPYERLADWDRHVQYGNSVRDGNGR